MKTSITIPAILFSAALLLAVQYAQAITIDMVPVGNPGNAPDTRSGNISVGSVADAYQIGKYEVTAGQYTEFLNAVAKADPNGLYNAKMGDPVLPSLGANIQRSGSSPNFSYSVATDWANRPANCVSFWDAARFANWLHNGQPTGAQGPETTEGGAYHDIGNVALFGRNTNAAFFIPTEDEWYKAAYHDKTAGLAATYFDFPNGSYTSVPGSDINETTNPGNNANYFIYGYAIGSPYYRTVVGEFEMSDSPYGTYDQGGNVAEWNETKLGSLVELRGGSFAEVWMYLNAGFPHIATDPTWEAYPMGFRVASITGDFDGDGAVDTKDYVIGRKLNPGYDDLVGHLGGWYQIIRANWHESLLGSGASLTFVPEPSTLLLGVMSAVGVLLRRRALR